jgi:hypothetical protein
MYATSLAATIDESRVICETCRYNHPPAFVRRAGDLQPCPECGGTQVAHCCDGLTACNDPPEDASVLQALDADAADESRYAELAAGLEEAGEADTIH